MKIGKANITFDECNFERNKYIEKSIKLEKENKKLIRTLKNILKDEELSLHWWKNLMRGFDGDIAMRQHHTKQIRRIKNTLTNKGV